ncbi:MAG: hypothetical protein JF587_15175 [Catenulisporales bacterium]|nr:hypothetical protein [Catenulisporales bacterium]
MSARFRAQTAAVAVAAAFALGSAGCASEGTVGAGGKPSSAVSVSKPPTGSAPSGTPTASSGTTTTSAGSKPSSSASPADPSALASSLKKLNDLWTDPGCKAGLHGFADYLTAAQESPAKADAAIPGAIRGLRSGAQSTHRPDAAQAMSNMAKDLQAMADADKAGKTADKGPLRNDWQVMGNACSG